MLNILDTIKNKTLSPDLLSRRLALGWRLALLVLGQVVMADLVFGQALTHGPVVGGVTASGANVFLRTSTQTTASLRYGTDPNLTGFVESSTFETSSDSDFTKIVPLAGLAAEQTYYLNPVVNGVPQLSAPYPSFTTFPAEGSSRTFKFIVLTDFETVMNLTKTTPTFASAAAESPAFAFIGGDFDHRNPKTLDQKREMFKGLYDPSTAYMSGFVPLILRRMPIIHQWDDHDSGLNNADKTYFNWTVDQQVFEEYVPTYALSTVKPGIWQKFSYAQVEGFVLDCRSQRDVETDPDDTNKSMLDGNNLGLNGELAWLENGLITSTARWKIIFSSVVTNTSTKPNDGWAAYQTEWNALKSFITSNNIEGVVFVSGDLHLGAIDNGTSAGFPEMCVAKANAETERGNCSTAEEGTWSEGYFENPCSGYGVVSIEENPDRLILEAVDESGSIRVSYAVTGTPTPTPTATATPTPTPAPPSIIRQPKNRIVAVGGRAKFTVAASGAPPLRYQWAKNGVNIAGAKRASYLTPATTLADDGSLFAVTVSNAAGSVTSTSAKLTVTAAPLTALEPPCGRLAPAHFFDRLPEKD
jgi:alkaline phosphatase D